MGLDSSSSCESLNDDTHNDIQVTIPNPSLAITSTPHQATHSPTEAVKSVTMGMQLPPLPINRPRILSNGNGAFISYVRRRGEPDGGRTDTESAPSAPGSSTASALYPTFDSSLANTTDSELSDGYISQTHLNKVNGPRLGYSSLRGPVRVSRPGGGGESDAAFTPSPPVTTQNPVDQNVSLALAHQTRIRNLYSGPGGTGINFLGDSVIPEMSVAPPSHSRRPDSSSSASSTTDWEGSGHATVLRRSNQPIVQQQGTHMPPLPPPRQNMPLVDSLRPLAPLAPVYNNLGQPIVNAAQVGTTSNAVTMTGTMESTSSDSDFERGLELSHAPMSHFRMKPKIKLGAAQSSIAARLSKEHALFMDRLSVRTEVSAAAAVASKNCASANVLAVANAAAGSRKPLNLPAEDDNALVFNASNLYFSPAESELMAEAKADAKIAGAAITASNSNTTTTREATKANTKTIQDSIMRHMNREMTPTISEVYHERNLGLGLAPPLSKLLLSKNYDESEAAATSGNSKHATSSCAIKSIVDAVSEIEFSGASSTSSVSTANTKTLNSNANNVQQTNSCNEVCSICGEPADIICRCKAATVQKKSTLKPWLSNVPSSIVKASDLTTADILERQNKIKTNAYASVGGSSGGTTSIEMPSLSMPNLKRSTSPFNELCRRDEGDGRSVADSQCSSTYKNDLINKNSNATRALETNHGTLKQTASGRKFVTTNKIDL